MTSVPADEGVPFGTKIHEVATKDPVGVGVIFGPYWGGHHWH